MQLSFRVSGKNNKNNCRQRVAPWRERDQARTQLPENKNPNNKSMMAKLKRELYLMTFKVTPFHGCFGSTETTKKMFIYLDFCASCRCSSSMGKPEMNCLSLMHVCPLLKDFGCNKF